MEGERRLGDGEWSKQIREALEEGDWEKDNGIKGWEGRK
jgi:hypothetical protein